MEKYNNNGIEPTTIREDNLIAAKDVAYDDTGPNMWNLYIRTVNGGWEDVQWMDVESIQRFFKTKLPVYKINKNNKYEIV